MSALWPIVLCGVLAILYAVWATRSVLAADPGNARATAGRARAVKAKETEANVLK